MSSEQRFSFTKGRLDALPPAPAGARTLYHDSHRDAAGLQMRITATGVKSFVLARRVAGKGVVWVTFGRYPAMTIEQARKAAREATAQALDGISPNEAKQESRRTGQTFQDLFDEHEKRCRAAKRRRLDDVRAQYERYLGRLPEDPPKHRGRKRAKPQGSVDWSRRRATEITADDVRALHAAIGKSGKPTTANRVVEIVSAIYNSAIKAGTFAGQNPAANVESFPEVERTRYLRADEVGAFFKALAEAGGPWSDFFLLCLLTGARRGNVASMRWGDIDLAFKTWRIPGTEFKTGQATTLPLADAAARILHARRPEPCDGDAFVFPAKSESGHIEGVKEAWARIIERAELADFRPHDLRHTAGSWLVASGASLPITGGALGHRDQKSTQRYAHLALEPVREALAKAHGALLDVVPK